MRRDRRRGGERVTSRVASTAAVGLALLAAALLGWRAALPSNRHRDLDVYAPPAAGEMVAQTTNGFDDVVTIVTAHNFARRGFLETHLLPDRRGAPLVSYFDFSHTQCESRAPASRPLVYPSFWEDRTELLSLNQECIYTHYPPLADWVFGAMASAGLGEVLHYKLLAVALNALLLLVLHAWLAREAGAAPALLATAAVATSPGYFEWAGALYYQPFQYLFLIGGLLAWRRYLEDRRRGLFAVTWLLFFCESLVSYELIAFFGLALAGYVVLERHGPPRRAVGLLAAQATAPLAAVALHFSLRLSLFGAARTWANAVTTATTRVLVGFDPWRVQLWFNRIHFKLMPIAWMAFAVVAVVAVRLAWGSEIRRPLALLTVLLAGALSFTCIFPGMGVMHTWMMYRHLLPFFAMLLALLCGALWRAAAVGASAAGAGRRTVAWGSAVLCALPLGALAARNARAIRAEVAWQAATHRHVDPENLAPRFLDALYWREGAPQTYSVRILTPLDGHRVDEAAHPSPQFVIEPGAPSHYEIWWLDPVDLRRVSFFTERPFPEALASGCRLSTFDGESFAPAPSAAAPALDDFVPDASEPVNRAYAWVRFAVSARTRALRLTCDGASPIPLHHLEVH